MIEGKKVLAIVPARGGSKGLPGKNIRELCGKPLIAWSIDAARDSAYIDEVVVSTDSDEIAEISRQYGASVPFMRPPELATDTADSMGAINHAIDYYEQRGKHFDLIAVIEPTSPLREAQDIDASILKLVNENAGSIVSVCLAETTHPAFMFHLDGCRLVTSSGKPFKTMRRQDLDPAYFLEGSVYISTYEALAREGDFIHENTIAYVVPKWKSPEIDDMVDLLLIETIMKNRELIK